MRLRTHGLLRAAAAAAALAVLTHAALTAAPPRLAGGVLVAGLLLVAGVGVAAARPVEGAIAGALFELLSTALLLLAPTEAVRAQPAAMVLLYTLAYAATGGVGGLAGRALRRRATAPEARGGA